MRLSDLLAVLGIAVCASMAVMSLESIGGASIATVASNRMSAFTCDLTDDWGDFGSPSKPHDGDPAGTCMPGSGSP